VSRETVVADLVRRQARQLKMPGAARELEALGRQAREERWAFEDYLHDVQRDPRGTNAGACS
jgi:hypothetical protein